MVAYSGEPLLVEAPKLGDRLRDAMADRGLNSLRKLEAASGVDKNTIQRWLKSDPPRAEVAGVRKVAEALETTAAALLDLPEAGEMPTSPSSKYPPELLNQIAGLDPTTLSALEETLPRLRQIVEEVRREDQDGDLE